jgi:hypothetical protein
MTAPETDMLGVRPGLAMRLFAGIQLMLARGIGVLILQCSMVALVIAGVAVATGQAWLMVSAGGVLMSLLAASLNAIARPGRVATPAWYAAVEQTIGREHGAALRTHLAGNYRSNHILAQSEIICAVQKLYAERARLRQEARRDSLGLRVGMLSID